MIKQVRISLSFLGHNKPKKGGIFLFTVFLQAVLSFAVLFILARIIGKQQVSQLTYYEYINGITFGSIAANMATDDLANMGDHLVGLITYGILTMAISYVTVKNRKLRKVLNGEPVVVIEDGQILENNLRKMNLELDELMMHLRVKDVFDFSQVELAIMESSGNISVIKKPAYDNVTKGDLKIKAQSDGLNVEVIVDGQVIYHNLQSMKLDGQWLMKKLKERGVRGFREVSLATVNKKHELKVDLYDDPLPGMMDMSDGDSVKWSDDQMNRHDPKAPSENFGNKPDEFF